MTREIISEAEFIRTKRNKDKLVVADFFASWCGPCRTIAPFVDELSRKHPEVDFIKINVEDRPSVPIKIT